MGGDIYIGTNSDLGGAFRIGGGASFLNSNPFVIGLDIVLEDGGYSATGLADPNSSPPPSSTPSRTALTQIGESHEKVARGLPKLIEFQANVDPDRLLALGKQAGLVKSAGTASEAGAWACLVYVNWK